MRTAAQPPTSTTSIPDVDSAREDLPDDTHVITFQRKLYDSFTSSNVLVWFDSAFQTYQNAWKLQ